jgi:hypothetical protein
VLPKVLAQVARPTIAFRGSARAPSPDGDEMRKPAQAYSDLIAHLPCSMEVAHDACIP